MDVTGTHFIDLIIVKIDLNAILLHLISRLSRICACFAHEHPSFRSNFSIWTEIRIKKSSLSKDCEISQCIDRLSPS